MGDSGMRPRQSRKSAFVAWRGRDATRVCNGVVELTSLMRGGHLAEFRFCDESGLPTQNVMWESPWMLDNAAPDSEEERTKTAGMTGHGLCLDYFGPPSEDEAHRGLGLHGEAVAMPWDVTFPGGPHEAVARWNVQLPAAQLRFERNISLADGESVLFVEETVINERELDHSCHWVQHATFSPPFLEPGQSSLVVSGARGITSPDAYDENSLLKFNREFLWPLAPAADGQTLVDLTQPFSTENRGVIAGVELDPTRETEYLLALNWKLRLGVGYCFRRRDFPWIAVWEENCARKDSPWNGTTRARGMEFGTTPLPLGREDTFRRGSLFGTPCWTSIPARGIKRARYLLFLFVIPMGLESVQNVKLQDDAIVLLDQHARPVSSILASGCGEFLGAKT